MHVFVRFLRVLVSFWSEQGRVPFPAESSLAMTATIVCFSGIIPGKAGGIFLRG